MAGGSQQGIAGQPIGLKFGRHASELLGEYREPLEPTAVDTEAGVIGFRKGDRGRYAGGNEAPLDQRLPGFVLNSQEDIGTGRGVVAQLHFQSLEISGGPMVAWVLAGSIGIVRFAEHARLSGTGKIERQCEGTFLPEAHVDRCGVTLHVVGLAVVRQRVVLEIPYPSPFVGETNVEQHAPQPADVLRDPAFVGPEFALPLPQLPLVEIGLQGPLVEKVARRDLNDHENDERKTQQQRNGNEQPLHDVGKHGRALGMPPGASLPRPGKGAVPDSSLADGRG